MNSFPQKEQFDHETAYLFDAHNVIENEDYCMKEFKEAFLKSSTEVKKQVRSSISSFIETLKEREDKLCQQIDQHVLRVIFYKENSRDSFLLDDSSSSCDGCYLPTLKMKFVNDSGNFEQKLKEFGSIKVETINSPVYSDIRKNGAPSRCSASPMNINTPRTSPESTGSVESFDVISDSDLAESPAKPVHKRVLVKDLLFNAIELALSNPRPSDRSTVPMKVSIGSHEPEIPPHPVTALIDQLRPYKNDPELGGATHKSIADSTTRNEQPSPSSIIKEKFDEYLCSSEQDKWLSSPY